MIWKAVKHRLADKAIKKQLPDEQMLFVPKAWNAVKNVGLIFQADDLSMIKEAEELVSIWEREGKQIQVLIYIPDTKKVPFETPNNWQVCTKKDFSSAGVPKTDLIQQFIQQPFDLLVDLNITGQVRLYTVSVLSKATFKIGADISVNKHLPFSVDISRSSEPNSVYKLGQELVHQLKKIHFA